MKNRVDRIETISSRVESNKKTPSAATYKLKYREEAHFLPVIKLEVDYLLYRLENSRTRRQQKGYLRLHSDLPFDFFDDPESSKAQTCQEEILLSMVLNHQDFINDLQQYGQDEPAIITYDGYLVNGNRRTAALKKIGIEYVECAVLPNDINAKEIYQIEQDLQIAEDFREDYDWINELLNIRAGKEDARFHLSERQLIKNLRITAQELKSRLFRIELVDNFLKWKEIPGQYEYDKLDDAEQIFKELEKGLKKYNDNIKIQTELQQTIFSLIEFKPEKGRLYDHVREVIRDFGEISERMKGATVSIDPSSSEKPTLEDVFKETDDDPFFGVSKDLPKPTSEPLKSKSTTFEDVKKLLEIKNDVKAEKQEKKSNEAAYDSISEALRNISGLCINDDSSKLIEAKKKLEELLRIGNNLMSELLKKIEGN